MPRPYEYQPLPNAKSFRVLSIHGASDTDTKASCELIPGDLDSPPEYEAISYTWEGQLPSEEIELDGSTMLVTANCHAALRRFRPRDPNQRSLLWIDSICIDQSEKATDERNVQVSLMGQIFSKAHHVVVFLDHSRMHNFHSHRRTFEWLQSLAALETIENEQDRSSRYSELAGTIRAHDLNDFFLDTPWFRRLWTVQEVALAQTSYLCWADLELSYPQLVRASGSDRFFGRPEEHDLAIRSALHIGTNGFYFADRVRRGRLPPGDIMELPDQLHASRPHDKVYSIYGLLDTTGVELPVPDYSVAVEEVYWRYTVALLKADRPTFLLDMVSNLTDRRPSWVHDLSIPERPNRVAYRRARKHQISYDLAFEEHHKYLLVRGVLVDSIVERARDSFIDHTEGSDPWNETSFYDAAQRCPSSLDPIRVRDHWNLQVIRNFLPTLLDRLDAQSHEDHLKSICGTLWSRQPSPPAKRGPFWRMLEMLSGLNVDLPTIREAGGEYGSRYQPTSARLQAMKMALSQQGKDAQLGTETVERIYTEPLNRARASVTGYSQYQTVFRARSGRLGMAPHSIRPGDKIFMFVGSQAPAVIHPVSDGRYRWVAQAYVHGLMEHDIYPEHEDQLEYVTFE